MFYLYYNNSAASDNQNPTDVWDSHYELVWHMNETSLDGTASEVKDSTSNNRDGFSNATGTCSPASGGDAGIAGYGVKFIQDPTNGWQGIRRDADDDFAVGTMELWAKPNSAYPFDGSDWGHLMTRGDEGATNNYQLSMNWYSTSSRIRARNVDGGGAGSPVYSTSYMLIIPVGITLDIRGVLMVLSFFGMEQ